MGTSSLTQSASDRYVQATGPVHTILVLAALAVWAFAGNILADQLSAAVNPHRIRFYTVTLLFEWLLFVLVVAGVRHSEQGCEDVGSVSQKGRLMEPKPLPTAFLKIVVKFN